MPIERPTSQPLPDRQDTGPSSAGRPADPPAAARFAKLLQRWSQHQGPAPGPGQPPSAPTPEQPGAGLGPDHSDSPLVADFSAAGAGKPPKPLRRPPPQPRPERGASDVARRAGAAPPRPQAESGDRPGSDAALATSGFVAFGQPGAAASGASRAEAPRTAPDVAEQQQFARFAAAIAEPGANAPTDTLSVTFSRADAVLSSALVERSADARLAITLTQNAPGGVILPPPSIASLEQRLQKRGLSGYRLAFTRKPHDDAAGGGTW